MIWQPAVGEAVRNQITQPLEETGVENPIHAHAPVRPPLLTLLPTMQASEVSVDPALGTMIAIVKSLIRLFRLGEIDKAGHHLTSCGLARSAAQLACAIAIAEAEQMEVRSAGVVCIPRCRRKAQDQAHTRQGRRIDRRQ